jgi:CheY-like chemotaxis protein
MNLAVNARDAMPEGGTLTISTTNVLPDEDDVSGTQMGPGSNVLITVSDTGCGMDEQTRRRIFEPFFTTKQPGKGTGLGLAMVYGIVKQHGGYITVSSKPGAGTTIRIYLPRSSGNPQAGLHMPETAVSSTGTETILLVEDDAVLRRLVFSQLTQLGYDVVEAYDCRDAIRLAQIHAKIHLLLTDVIMPEMSGRHVFEQLVVFHPHVRVLYMSGYPRDVIAHHRVLDDGIHFLQKPFTQQVLAQKIREVLSVSGLAAQ